LTAGASFTIHASLIEAPVLWVGRLCIFYALLKAGLAGSEANPLVSGTSFFVWIFKFLASFLDVFQWVLMD